MRAARQRIIRHPHDMDSNPSQIREGHADELTSLPHWGELVIPLAAVLILGATSMIWMDWLVRI